MPLGQSNSLCGLHSCRTSFRPTVRNCDFAVCKYINPTSARWCSTTTETSTQQGGATGGREYSFSAMMKNVFGTQLDAEGIFYKVGSKGKEASKQYTEHLLTFIAVRLPFNPGGLCNQGHHVSYSFSSCSCAREALSWSAGAFVRAAEALCPCFRVWFDLCSPVDCFAVSLNHLP